VANKAKPKNLTYKIKNNNKKKMKKCEYMIQFWKNNLLKQTQRSQFYLSQIGRVGKPLTLPQTEAIFRVILEPFLPNRLTFNSGVIFELFKINLKQPNFKKKILTDQ
jgi:hypothetical protein